MIVNCWVDSNATERSIENWLITTDGCGSFEAIVVEIWKNPFYTETRFTLFYTKTRFKQNVGSWGNFRNWSKFNNHTVHRCAGGIVSRRVVVLTAPSTSRTSTRILKFGHLFRHCSRFESFEILRLFRRSFHFVFPVSVQWRRCWIDRN